MLNRHSTVYRILAILVAFALIGIAIFVPLAMPEGRNDIILIVAASIWGVALIATIVTTEIYWRKRKKNKDE